MLFSPEVLLVSGVITITVIPELVLYLSHDDGHDNDGQWS